MSGLSFSGDIFVAENWVIMTSKHLTESLQWRLFVVKYWKNLMRHNSKFLVVAGIHGYGSFIG